ncbi:hypothetical protein OHT76_25375 [Streptomyces sp. NBC_00287]|uniref:hypothetical protein n=1 Tax=Streptomyces sp. NBC_00287 TaxID=2975702 RepID=UPI002E2A8881|nr:hypothetical protein [Streptomyces sp. NBC_00287]
MHSDPAIESSAATRGRRRKRGNGSAEGPVFVDNSGRRSKALRRIGIAVGVGCVGYAVVLGMAFMGIGISADPATLLPFGNSAQGGGPGGAPGEQPQGGVGGQVPPSGAPSAPPSGTPAPTASAPTASASAVADTAN